jgi:Raf kinase inhibitor-like YbhB/YbcL family protein
MILESSAFKPGEAIPAKYTCDGEDLSPPLSWSAMPANARSLALTAVDPDAPRGTWVHWVAWNIPANTHTLSEGFPKEGTSSTQIKQGMTDFKRPGYGGPCPPSGTHRYFFTLYALDTVLNLPPQTTKSELQEAMKGHIVDQAELMGTYQRK